MPAETVHDRVLCVLCVRSYLLQRPKSSAIYFANCNLKPTRALITSMTKALLTALILTALILSTTGAEIYRDIYITIPGEEVCTQKLGLAYRAGDLWLPVENGTIFLSETEQCTTDERGYCNISVERDKVYAVKSNNNTVKLFIGCQEVVIVIRV